ncbi:YdcF family protein [Ammoniphilus sp. 3BR4]|uniref:YdcF family protein n=1 Tax=Ammoniphilus sp. 3BR4 TaxID=3158265 RepID=UPI003466FF84
MKLKRLVLGISLLSIIFVGNIAMSIWTFKADIPMPKTDAAIVLGAAVWGADPSPVFRERINHAVWLYKHGYAGKIIFTGGSGSSDELAESYVAKRYAIGSGVKEESILMEEKSKITEENLRYAYQVAKEHDLRTFSIVSDPLHMKRSMMLAKDMGMEAYPSPTPTSVYKSMDTRLSFLGRETFFYIGYLLTKPFR